MDTREWKEYRIGEIFNIKSCKCQDASELEEGKDTFYIGAKKDLLGIMKNVAIEQDLMIDGNCIVFICQGQGSAGYANYVPCDFIGATSLRVGYHKKLNKFNGMFIATILDLQRPRFSFGRGWGNTLKDTIINLPTTTNNQPDWQFMEDYIKKIYNKVIEEIKASAPALLSLSLSLSLKNRPVMKCEEWREFLFNKIFEVKNAKNINSPDLEYTNNTNDTPHVSRQIEDNGIKGYVAKFDTKKLNKGHCLCVDMFLNSTWQEKDFLACDHVLTARNKNLNKFRALFVVAVLRNEQYRFSYGKIFSVEQSDFKINLPTTPQGEPDWVWMERYVRRIFG